MIYEKNIIPNVNFHEEDSIDLLNQIFGKENVFTFDNPHEVKRLYKFDLEGHSLILRTSINSAKIIYRSLFNIPWNGHRYFDCDVWVPKLKQWYLNQDYNFLDLEEIQRRFYSYYIKPLFIRPNSGDKTFAGQVFYPKTLENEILYLKSLNYDPKDVFCLYASQSDHIKSEYRCVIVNNKCISSSRYMKDGKLDTLGRVPKNVYDFVEQIIHSNDFLQYEVMDYCLDVGIVDGDCYLIEINSTETSSFYGANLKKIYEAIKNRE